jgi:hypothetical protein
VRVGYMGLQVGAVRLGDRSARQPQVRDGKAVQHGVDIGLKLPGGRSGQWTSSRGHSLVDVLRRQHPVPFGVGQSPDPDVGLEGRERGDEVGSRSAGAICWTKPTKPATQGLVDVDTRRCLVRTRTHVRMAP